MLDNTPITDYFGFDLGDGESAVAWMRAGKNTEPQLIELRGRKSVITALASHPEQGLYIGEEACHLTGADWIEMRFKGRYLRDTAAAGRLIGLFAQQVLKTLTDDHRMDSVQSARFFIGCPSGWPQDVRDEYRKLFERAGFVHCDIVSESRAAFMFARESGELRVSDDMLTLPTLIIDAGSSTTDFTYVADLSERMLKTGDFGDVSLGGGLLDALLLDLNLRRSPARKQLEVVFARFPQYKARCEFEARRVKEMYFTQARRGSDSRAESAVKLYIGREPVTFELSCDERDMNGLLQKPLEALRGLSFEEAYKKSLQTAREQLDGSGPDIILLTGGASRMPLIEDEARAAFPNAQVLRGLEPEFAIARGLCYALKIDTKCQGFMDDVQALINSDEMEDLVLLRLRDLFEAISKPMAEKLVEDVAPQVFELWREGGLKTFDDIGVELSRRIQDLLKRPEAAELIKPAVREWVIALRPDIERLTDPICEKYDLPPTSLRLPENLDISAAQISVGSDSLLRVDELKALIDIITATVVAAVLGGSGVALLATGLPGIIGGFLVGLLAAFVGTEIAQRALKKADLPAWMRRLITPRYFRGSLRKRQSEIAVGIAAQLEKEIDPPSEAVSGMVRKIATSIEQQLDSMMRHATLLIR